MYVFWLEFIPMMTLCQYTHLGKFMEKYVESQGDGGFGYDKIFYIDNSKISMASIAQSLKIL